MLGEWIGNLMASDSVAQCFEILLPDDIESTVWRTQTCFQSQRLWHKQRRQPQWDTRGDGQTGSQVQVIWLPRSRRVSELWHSEPWPLRRSLLKQSHGKLKLEREQRELDPWDATAPEAHRSLSFPPPSFLSFSSLLGKRGVSHVRWSPSSLNQTHSLL